MKANEITDLEKELEKQSITFKELKEGLIKMKNIKDEYRQASIILIRNLLKSRL